MIYLLKKRIKSRTIQSIVQQLLLSHIFH